MEGNSAWVVLDLCQLRNVTLNDEALMRELIHALVSDASQKIEKLQQAAERSDSEECARLAHGLMGACGNVGAVSLSALLGSVEYHAAAGDLRLCQPSIKRLNSELEKLRSEVSAM